MRVTHGEPGPRGFGGKMCLRLVMEDRGQTSVKASGGGKWGQQGAFYIPQLEVSAWGLMNREGKSRKEGCCSVSLAAGSTFGILP